jgi:hypothetical protein
LLELAFLVIDQRRAVAVGQVAAGVVGIGLAVGIGGGVQDDRNESDQNLERSVTFSPFKS